MPARREETALGHVVDAVSGWETNIPLADIRDTVSSLEVIIKTRDMRREVLRNLSKSWPSEQVAHRQLPPKRNLLSLGEQLEPKLIPHATYRNLIRQAMSLKQVRQIMRTQLLAVRHPKDLLRIAAVAMQERSHAEQLANFDDPIRRALYRCRETVSDTAVLRTCSTLITRLRFAGLEPHHCLIFLGTKFAARARSLTGMKKFLRLIHDRRLHMTSYLFRSIVAKFSIGHRGLGEIRNGRWRRADLLQVLTGFDDCKHLSPDQQYHFGTFLDRRAWEFLHGWVAVLARCKANDAVWDEWLMWKQNPARTRPKRLGSPERPMTTRMRGDYWFLEQMTYTGDLNRAWSILEETTIPLSTLNPRIKYRLLDGVEHASIWTPQMTEAMLEKYDADLSQIERAFGVAWESGKEDGEGQHVLFRDQEEALDELGAEEWKADEDHGFPTEDNNDTCSHAILSTHEEQLYDAAKSAPREISFENSQ